MWQRPSEAQGAGSCLWRGDARLKLDGELTILVAGSYAYISLYPWSWDTGDRRGGSIGCVNGMSLPRDRMRRMRFVPMTRMSAYCHADTDGALGNAAFCRPVTAPDMHVIS